MSAFWLLYPHPSLSFLSAFLSISPLLRWTKGDSFSLQIMMSQPSDGLPTFFRNNCLTRPTSSSFSWQSRGRMGRQPLCSQACSCTGLVVTEFTVSTGCQANWDFTVDKALGFPLSGIFYSHSQFLFLYMIWQLALSHFKLPQQGDFKSYLRLLSVFICVSVVCLPGAETITKIDVFYK